MLHVKCTQDVLHAVTAVNVKNTRFLFGHVQPWQKISYFRGHLDREKSYYKNSKSCVRLCKAVIGKVSCSPLNTSRAHAGIFTQNRHQAGGKMLLACVTPLEDMGNT